MNRLKAELPTRLALSLLLFAIVFSAAAADLVPVEALGLRIAPGFRITLYADSDLAPDIYAMTLDARGRVVVTSQGYIKTLLDTDGDGKADQAVLFATTQTGGMGLCFDGNDLYFSGDGFFSVYHDRDGDGHADGPAERIFPVHTGEHGGHAMRLGPDGYWYLIGGNESGFAAKHVTAPRSPIREPEAGAILRVSPDLKQTEIIAQGLRNPYDFDFNWAGDLFTYDSDVERDFFLPWYTPTRVDHIGYGLHHGWRLNGWERSWARPNYYPDVVDILWPVGRGSPTGVTCYRHHQFPAHYRDGLFALDWTFGKVYFLPLEPLGATYQTRPEIFLEPIGTQGFAPTDVAVAPDGSLFLCIGGRKTRGAVYHIEYVGDAQRADLATTIPDHADTNSLASVLAAPQPLDAWSRARWMPAAKTLGATPFLQAVADQNLASPDRVRAIEVLTELFGGVTSEAANVAAKAWSPQVRARIAWALGRKSNASAIPLLTALTRDEHPLVRRCALEALADRGEEVEAAAAIPILLNNLGNPEKRVRQAAARWAAGLPPAAWKTLSADLETADAQTRLTGAMAALWRGNQNRVRRDSVEPKTVRQDDQGSTESRPTKGDPRNAARPEGLVLLHTNVVGVALSVLKSSEDTDLRLQAVRLIMLALGDYHLYHPSVEVYTAYELAQPLRDHEALVAEVLRSVRPILPAGENRLDMETARLLAMLSDPDTNTISKVVAFLTPASPPTSDFHYLAVLSRLRASLPKETSEKVARAIAGLDRKLEGQELRNKQMWTARLAEVVAQLAHRDPALADHLLALPDFPRAGNLELVDGFDAGQRRRAAEAFLKAVKASTNFVWSGELIDLLSSLPAKDVRPLLRQQWDNRGLRDALALELAKHPEAEDRDKFLAALESGQPQVVGGCLNALEQLPADSTPEKLVPVLRLLRRLLSEPKAEKLRAQSLALINRQSGETLAVKEESTERGGLKKAYQPVLDRFTARYPRLTGQLEGESDEDPAKWKQILQGVAWNAGEAARGEKLFRERACQTCHAGATPLGPSLAGVTSRFSVEDLFNAILYPSRDVAPLYRTTTFETRDGQSYTGLVAFESADGVIVQTGATTTVRLATSDLVSRSESDLSLMPTGLMSGLKPADLADLYSYLKSLPAR
ncbi:MAG: HEAT repeat domain-containing protein [Limisphaerales bacterium]